MGQAPLIILKLQNGNSNCFFNFKEEIQIVGQHSRAQQYS